MNYAYFVYDSSSYGVIPVTAICQGEHGPYNSFNEAKEGLIKHLSNTAEAYKDAVKKAKNITDKTAPAPRDL